MVGVDQVISVPRLEYRPELPFVAIQQHVTIPFGNLLFPLWEETAGWLDGKGIQPAGPPFIRYLTVDMEHGLDIQVGFPIVSNLPGDERMVSGTLPAGAYAGLIYTGTYDNQGLLEATASLLNWAVANQIHWETKVVDEVEWWQARLEVYLTDPVLEPDPKQWQTELVFLTSNQ